MKNIFLALFLVITFVDAKELFNIKTTTVKKESIDEKKSFYGYAQIDETLLQNVTLMFDGMVENINADKKYQFIKKGELLFNLNCSEIYSLQNELIDSEDNKSIQDDLYKKLLHFGLSKSFLDSILSSKKAQESIPIYSPIDGYILKKEIYKGSCIKKGELLYQLVDLSRFWVMAKVYESDIDFVRNATKVKVVFDNYQVDTKVDFIYPIVNLETKTIDVRLIIENPNLNLFINSFAKVEFYQNKKDILTLPKSAVVTKSNRYYVFTKSEFEGEYNLNEIKAYRLSNDKFEILSGLKEGDVVADSSLFLLDSDVQINGNNW